jgi:predicted ester cyclase
MTTEENKALVRRYIEEAYNKRNLAIIDELVAATYTVHPSPPDRKPGIEGERQFVSMALAEWPDLRLTIEDQVAEGDKVVSRWTARGTHTRTVTTEYGSIAPTNTQVTLSGMGIDRIEGGKLAESWGNADWLGLLQQIGAVPTPAPATR